MDLVERINASTPAFKPDTQVTEIKGAWIAVGALVVGLMTWLPALIVVTGQRLANLF
jgi:hypothetical protein